MACGCAAARRRDNGGQATAEAPRREAPAARLPYDTLPLETCLLCADKHVCAACAEAAAASDPCTVLGELELARRHLLGAPGTAAAEVAGAMLEAAAGTPDWRGALNRLSDRVCGLLAEVEDGDTAARGAMAAGDALRMQDTDNQLLGVVRLGAACRMSRELGYMPKNRAVIVGDLVAAAEQLVRHDNDLATLIRNLRHEVQVSVRADLSAAWLDVCARAARTLPGLGEELDGLLVGLRAYLGLPADFIPGV